MTMVMSWFVSNVFEAVLGAGLVRRFVGPTVRLDSVRTLAVFVACASFFAAAESAHGPIAAFGFGCFGPLELDYDYDRIAGLIDRDTLAARPFTMRRYAELLPLSWPPAVAAQVRGSPPGRANRLAERLRLAIERRAQVFREVKLQVTVSVGVAERTDDQCGDWRSLVRIADQRMYAAKRAGRDRVHCPHDSDVVTARVAYGS